MPIEWYKSPVVDRRLGLLPAAVVHGRLRSAPVRREHGIAAFLNPHSYRVLRGDPHLIAAFDDLYVDGFLLKLCLRISGHRVARVSMDFTGIAAEVLTSHSLRGSMVGLVGGTPGTAAAAARLFGGLFPGLHFLGRSGYFESSEHREHVIQEIVAAAPRLVLVGMGAGQQERFLVELWARGWRGEGYTCGAFLEQTAQAGGAYYPALVDKLNLRWVYRMIREPRMVRRYLLSYPVAISLYFGDELRWRMSRASPRR